MSNCENCENEHDGEYGSGRFCSSKCARGFSTKAKRNEINEKVSKKMTGRKLSNETILKITNNENVKYWKNKKRSKETKDKIKKSNEKYRNLLKEKHCRYCSEIKVMSYYGSVCEDCKGPYKVYKEQCSFKFNIYDFPDLFNLSLIEKYGWYSPKNSKNPNLNGVSRDHIFSISNGFKLGIDPKIISHPKNCSLIRHSENNKKNIKCNITLEELLEKINSYMVR